VAGTWRVELATDQAGCGTIKREIAVSAVKPAAPRQTAGSLWPVRDTEPRDRESLFAWIEKLFDAPIDAAPSWKALHEVLARQVAQRAVQPPGLRRFDEYGSFARLRRLPYFLRAYFSFKMGLPYGYAKCTRGSGGDSQGARSVEHSEP